MKKEINWKEFLLEKGFNLKEDPAEPGTYFIDKNGDPVYQIDLPSEEEFINWQRSKMIENFLENIK